MKRIALLISALVIPAVLIYAQVPDKNKKEAKKAYNQAVTLISEGNFEPAITYLDACLDLDSSFTMALSVRARAKVETGDMAGALNDFRILAEKDLSAGEPYFYFAYLAFTDSSE